MTHGEPVERANSRRQMRRQRQCEQRADVGQQLFGRRAEEALDAGLQLAEGRSLVVRIVDVEATSKHLAKRPVAERAAERHALAFGPLQASAARVQARLVEQPRLAQAGLADETEEAANAGLDAFDALVGRSDLGASSDHRNDAGGRRSVLRFMRVVRAADAHERMDGERFGLALERPRAHRHAFDKGIDGAEHAVADENRPRLGLVLQPRRDIRRVADGGVVHAQVVADLADHDHARVQPDAQPQWRLAVRHRTGIDAPANCQRRQNRAPRMILVRQRRAEQRHEAIAEELIDRALVAVHLGQRRFEERTEDRVHALGTRALGHLGRIGDVAEQHRDRLALAFEGAARAQDFLGQVSRCVAMRGGQRRDGGKFKCATTFAAEFLAGWAVVAAVETLHCEITSRKLPGAR